MQLSLEVYCTAGPSLRDAIARSRKLEDFDLRVKMVQRSHRRPGWLDIASHERHGAIKVTWDPQVKALRCRIVTRKRGRPDAIAGDLLHFLLESFRRRIVTIVITT